MSLPVFLAGLHRDDAFAAATLQTVNGSIVPSSIAASNGVLLRSVFSGNQERGILCHDRQRHHCIAVVQADSANATAWRPMQRTSSSAKRMLIPSRVINTTWSVRLSAYIDQGVTLFDPIAMMPSFRTLAKSSKADFLTVPCRVQRTGTRLSPVVSSLFSPVLKQSG